MEITFRPLAEADFDDLHVWLNRPHLTRFFQKRPISRSQIGEKYLPRVRGDDPTHSHLALEDGTPFGYLQCYRIADYPDWAAVIDSHDGIGIDLAIFDPAYLRLGMGRAMLFLYMREIAFPLFPDETKCFIAHEIENEAAIACSQAIGFKLVRTFEEDGIPSALFIQERDKSADSLG